MVDIRAEPDTEFAPQAHASSYRIFESKSGLRYRQIKMSFQRNVFLSYSYFRLKNNNFINIHSLIFGIFSELGGRISMIKSWITEKANRTVMERDTFSPQSAGSQNTPNATNMIKIVGQMMLNT